MNGKILLVMVLFLLPSIAAQSKPDIYISDFEISPLDIYSGDQIRLNVTVGNLGAEAGEIEIALFVDNRTQAVYEVVIEELNSGEEDETILYWIAEEGKHTLFIFADYNGKIEEENEDNNIVSLEIDVNKPIYPPFPPSSLNATWWNSEWHYRIPMIASMIGQRESFAFKNKMVYCNINFTALMNSISYDQAGSFSKRTFYPDSVRIIEYELQDNNWIPLKNIGREVILNDDYDALENANITIIWIMEDDIYPHERRYYYLYWDTVENGNKKGEFARIYAGLKNGEFEDKFSTQWKTVTEGQINWDIG